MKTKKHSLLLGAHISIAGGLEKAFFRGQSIGCTTIQIFTKSNRQWQCKPLTKSEIELFKKTWEQSPIKSVVVHASYLINLGSSNPEVITKSTRALKEELLRCSQLGIPYLILHPGSHGTSPKKNSLLQVAKLLDEVFQAVPGNSMILLETMAGQGSNLGAEFEELAEIYKASANKKRIGICFDTCHTFAAGYNTQTKKTYEHTWQLFDTVLGFDLLKVIHVNDSKKELGSRVDRHEHIGKGKLGKEAFRLLFNDERFFTIPKILETPKEELAEDLKNMKEIVSLLDADTKNVLDIKVPEKIVEERVSNR